MKFIGPKFMEEMKEEFGGQSNRNKFGQYGLSTAFQPQSVSPGSNSGGAAAYNRLSGSAGAGPPLMAGGVNLASKFQPAERRK